MADVLGGPRNPLVKIRDYASDVRAEMKRVTWPNKHEIYGTTMMVVLTTFIFGIYFWICDEFFSRLVGNVLRFFLHGR